MMRRTVFASLSFMVGAEKLGSSDEVAAVQMAVNRHSKAATPRERFTQELVNYKDLSYTGIVDMGGQQQRVIFDTGSFELLLFSKSCKSYSCSNTEHFFDENKSKTFKNLKWSRMHSFGSGDCQSVLGEDEITLGPNKATQTFWDVIDANMPIIQDGSFDGILGLAHPDGPMDEVRKYLEEDMTQKEQCKGTKEGCPEWLKNQTKADKKFKKMVEKYPPPLKNLQITEFSVCFKKESGAPGYFTWNDINPAKHPEIFTKLEVTGDFMWTSSLHKVQLGDFKRGGKSKDLHLSCGNNKPCSAVLDTGTSLVAAPSEVIQKIFKKLGKVDASCDDIHNMPNLVFEFGGKTIEMPPETYIGKVAGEMPAELGQFFPHIQLNKEGAVDSQCTLLMMSMDMQGKDGPLWIIGMPFFREFYTTFSMGDDPTYAEKKPRSIYIAKNSADCKHPSEYKELPPREVSVRKPVIRTLDLSSVRVPPWVRRSAKAGSESARLTEM